MAVAAYPVVIEVGSDVLHDIQSHEEALKMGLEDTTSYSQTTPGTTRSIPTVLEGDYKFSGSFNKTDTAQVALRTNFLARTLTTFTLTHDSEETTFTAWINEYTIKGEVKGKVNLDISVKLDGGVTIT